MAPPGPPLRPSGEEGRSLLRGELLHDEYHRQHLVQRLLAWLWRRLEGGVGEVEADDSWAEIVIEEAPCRHWQCALRALGLRPCDTNSSEIPVSTFQSCASAP